MIRILIMLFRALFGNPANVAAENLALRHQLATRRLTGWHCLPRVASWMRYLVGTTIKFAHYDPDFKVRMEASQVLEQSRAALPK